MHKVDVPLEVNPYSILWMGEKKLYKRGDEETFLRFRFIFSYAYIQIYFLFLFVIHTFFDRKLQKLVPHLIKIQS